jgi:hypothetical protein
MTQQLRNVQVMVDDIHNKATAQLERDREDFLSNLEKWGCGTNPHHKSYYPALLTFVEKYLEWHTASPESRMWVYQMFSEVIPQPCWGDGNIFGPLLQFLGYHVYDDGSFSVKWYKHLYKSELREFEGKTYEYPTSEYLARVETTPGDYKDAFPVLVDDFSGTQDPAIIVEAMLKHESNQLKKQAEYMEAVQRYEGRRADS